MSDQIVTLIAALIGGLLAVVGGFLATYFQQRVARDAEKRKVIREKVEEIYNFTNQVNSWVLEQVSIAQKFAQFGKAEVPQPVMDFPINKLETLVVLYIPSLQLDIRAYHSLLKKLEVTQDAVVVTEDVPMTDSSAMLTDFFKKILSEDELKIILRDFEAFEQLQTKIQTSLKKLIQY